MSVKERGVKYLSSNTDSPLIVANAVGKKDKGIETIAYYSDIWRNIPKPKITRGYKCFLLGMEKEGKGTWKYYFSL